jgi:hypothetical protein
MLYKYEYKTIEEREEIFSEHKELYWVAEENISVGNFLTFSSICPDFEGIKNAWINNQISYDELYYYMYNGQITRAEYDEIYALNPHQ